MTKRTQILIAAAVTGILLSGTAAAEVTSKRTDLRQTNQHERIAQGVKNGSLTRPETAKLVSQQAHIHRTERRFEADGKLSNKERLTLERKQDRASRNIYRKKHNARARY